MADNYLKVANGLNVGGLTPSKVTVTDASNNIASATTTTTEVQLLSGRTNLGPTTISSNTTAVTETNQVGPTTLMSYTIPANTLSANGDQLNIDAGLEWGADLGTAIIGATVLGTGLWEYSSNEGFRMGTRLVITRVSSSSAYLAIYVSGDNGEGAVSVVGQGALVSGLNFASTNSFNFYGYNAGGGSFDYTKQYFMNVQLVKASN